MVLLVIGLSIVPYGLIVAVGLLYGKKQVSRPRKDHDLTVSVFIPTYNEERYVSKKLDNIFEQTLAPHEVLILDCSTDRTREIVEKYTESHPAIRLVRQPNRIGMAKTLNEALNMASGDILVYTGCDSLAKSPSCLETLVSHFSDPNIGAVSGVCANSGLEGQFRKFTTWIQKAESNIDSTVIAHGGPSMTAFRRALAEPVNPNSLADDTEAFVKIRKKGFKTILDPEVVSEEVLPDSFVGRRMQKDRRAEGIIRVLFENLSVAFNPRYGRYGLLIFPIDLFLLVASPFILIADFVLLGYFLFAINPVYLLGFLVALGISFMSTKMKALVDIQISGLVGSIRAAFPKSSNLWPKERLRPN